MAVFSTFSLEQSHKEIARLLALIKQQENTIQNLNHQLHLFRTARFGRKSEKCAVAEQLQLNFDEAKPSLEVKELGEEDSSLETITYTRSKKSTGRKALPKSLPYVEKVYDISENEKQCDCGCQLTHITDEITEQLDIVPQMTFRVVHIRKKYACKQCEETIKLAKLPKQPIDKSIAAPGLIAAIIDNKFNRHLPLYRQEKMFDEASIPITRGTLSNWVIKSADLLIPLVKLLIDEVVSYDIAYADETPLQVLKEKNRLPTQKSYMWLFIGGPPDKRAFVYQYHISRSHKVPFEFFMDFNGYLHADCYQAYVNLDKLESIKHVACWAHARRYFVDVVKSTKKKGLAHKIVDLIGKLYNIERELKEISASENVILERRQNEAAQILLQIKSILDDAQFNTLPQSPIGKAIFYAINHWNALNVYLQDGRLDIDNNLTERAIKPFVIGRKNWLFHGNDIGANAGSILYSLIETCKYHKVDVFSWFKYTLTNIHSADTVDKLEKLLPYNIDLNLLTNMRSLPNIKTPE